jgi:diadenosine tetraphosphate (Ap4A) HIT family hydrolase
MQAISNNVFTQNCISCKPFDEEEAKRTIFTTKHCKIVFRTDDQSWLGRCIVVPKEHISNFEEFFEDKKVEILKDIYECRSKINQVYKRIFGMNFDNWLQLGNLTRNEHNELTTDIRYFHIHYHIIPRYAKPIERFGQVFEDKQFGKALNIDPACGHKKVVLSKEQMAAIRDEVQAELIKSKLIGPENLEETMPSTQIKSML